MPETDNSQYIGHDKCWAIVQNSLERGKLHHGWILSGAKGMGKAGFAKHMAYAILDPNGSQRHLIDAGTHPDYHIVSRPPKEWPKEGEGIAPNAELKRSINIEQIRKLQTVLNVKPSMSDKRVIIIDAADDMEKAAANALLKSLEEPPQGTIFILISHASEKLLPTIKSRCQTMRFDPLSEEQMIAALDMHLSNISETERAALVRAGSGSPGRALAFLGLDLAEIDNIMSSIKEKGDSNNALRTKLVKLLTLKATQAKYESFLRRAPSYIAAHAHHLPIERLKEASDAYTKATSLASRAIGVSLDKPAVIFEMVSLLSVLQTNKPSSYNKNRKL